MPPECPDKGCRVHVTLSGSSPALASGVCFLWQGSAWSSRVPRRSGRQWRISSQVQVQEVCGDGGTAHRGSGEGHGWGGGGELGKGQKGWEEECASGSLHSPPSQALVLLQHQGVQHWVSPGCSGCSGVRQNWLRHSLPWSGCRGDAALCHSAVLLGRSAGPVPLISFNEALQFFQTTDLSECRVCAGPANPTFTPELFPASCSLVGQLRLVLLFPIASALPQPSSV